MGEGRREGRSQYIAQESHDCSSQQEQKLLLVVNVKERTD